MPLTLNNEQALGSRRADSVTVTSVNTAFQVVRIPWSDPQNRKAKIRKLMITNNQATAAILQFWDADLSSSTPATRGTGTLAGALLTIGIAASGTSGVTGTTAVYGEADLPAIEFEAGVACTSSTFNTNIAIELEVY